MPVATGVRVAVRVERVPAVGDRHYAGWLENAAGFKIEIVADVVV
ncbi:hypothetical protein [Microbacterium sp. BF1]